jgi:hypothetical protein
MSATAGGSDAQTAALEGLHPVVCTPDEERIFTTLLAAVRHFGASADFALATRPSTEY